jgi:hypothetical protein
MKKLMVTLVAVFVLGGLGATIIPDVIAAREVGRRASCVNKGHELSGAYGEGIRERYYGR